jgi:hypothetical protein
MDGACNVHRETATGYTVLVGEPAGTRPLETHWF